MEWKLVCDKINYLLGFYYMFRLNFSFQIFQNLLAHICLSTQRSCSRGTVPMLLFSCLMKIKILSKVFSLVKFGKYSNSCKIKCWFQSTKNRFFAKNICRFWYIISKFFLSHIQIYHSSFCEWIAVFNVIISISVQFYY